MFKKLAISSVAGLTAASLMLSGTPAHADGGDNDGIEVNAPLSLQLVFCHVSVFIGLKSPDDCRDAARGEIFQPEQIDKD